MVRTSLMPGARCPRGRRSRKGFRKNEKVHNRLTFQCRPLGWSWAVGQPDPPKIIATLKENGEVFIFILTSHWQSFHFYHDINKSSNWKKITFSWSRNGITTVSTGLNSSNCLDTLRPASTLKVLRYSWPLPIIGKKNVKTCQWLAKIVKYCQILAGIVKYC